MGLFLFMLLVLKRTGWVFDLANEDIFTSSWGQPSWQIFYRICQKFWHLDVPIDITSH